MSNNETYTVLWETNTPFKNQYTISLNDSIDNYDEIVYYGSANRGGTSRVKVKTGFPVVSGVINLGGPYTLNTWEINNYYMLNNGTQVFLSGNSGFIGVSYYWGMQNGGTGFEANRYTTARNADVHPYKIVGVKNKLTDKIWETTGNTYETNITLDEPITHFDKILIYSSGTEDAANGVHLAKNVYTVQPQTVNGCDVWGYSPWATNFRCNYILGSSLKLSGSSGHIGSAYFWGIGKDNASWAAGKWVTTAAPRMLQPYKIFGLGRHPSYKISFIQSDYGTITSSPITGYENDIATLSNTPISDDWKCSSYNITGATLTGDQFKFETSDVTAEGGWEHSKNLYLINGEHGILSADKNKGFFGDVVTVDANTDEGWYLTGLNITGATATGTKFMFGDENVTAEGLYTDEGFPVVYESEDGVHLTGDPIAIPGIGMTLTETYEPYYRPDGYEVTGGYVENGMLYATGPCTARLKAKVNAFTATGVWQQGSNVTAGGGGAGGGGASKWVYNNVGLKYATVNSITGDVPSTWTADSNIWKPSNASSYSMDIYAYMYFTWTGKGRNGSSNTTQGAVTGVCLLGGTQSNSQSFSVGTNKYGTNSNTMKYNKQFTTTTVADYYGISARIGAKMYTDNTYSNYGALTTYVATATTGSWTATGYAP